MQTLNFSVVPPHLRLLTVNVRLLPLALSCRPELELTSISFLARRSSASSGSASRPPRSRTSRPRPLALDPLEQVLTLLLAPSPSSRSAYLSYANAQAAPAQDKVKEVMGSTA